MVNTADMKTASLKTKRQPIWEAVSVEGGGIEVRAKFGSIFYTIADVYCSPHSRASENAKLIATALNLGKRLVNTRRAE